ncbi:hypothetical protein VTH06DRAFT_8013 [Thermothelomyces fergusii]
MPPQEEKTIAGPPSSSKEDPLEIQIDGSSKVQPPPSLRSRAWSHLNETLRASVLVEIELLILTFCIGLQDAVSFPDFHCFASNQTGNTVFLTLAVVLPEANGDIFYTSNIAVALGFFLAGACVTGQLGQIVGPRRRWWLVCCNLVQTLLVSAAAAVQYTHSRFRYGGNNLVFERHAPTASTLWAIGLLAVAAGSQVVQTRSFRMSEITTAMATAAWVDLVADPGILALRNRGRNRRAGFLAALVLGSIAGALVLRRLGSPPALVISAAGKLLVAVMYLFNPAEQPKAESPRGSA